MSHGSGLMDLVSQKDRAALVTGGSGGIGSAVVNLCLAAGAEAVS